MRSHPLAVAVLLAVSLLGTACAPTVLESPPATSPTPPREPASPEPEDLSSLSRVAAFERLHQRISTEYAFTDWKRVDWAELYREYLPQIRAADSAAAYLVAVHAYLGAVPDGHVSVGPADEAGTALLSQVIDQQSGGSFGLGLVETDDGSLLAAAVAPGSPADKAGIKAGARIVGWDGRPPTDAITDVDLLSLVGAPRPATSEGQRLEQVRMLGRAPVGTVTGIDYLNPGATAAERVRLTAIADGMAWAPLATFLPKPDPNAPVVSRKKLASGLGYVKLTALADLANLADYPTHIAEQFTAAVTDLADQQVTGLIVDLRSNVGGYDTLAATICGLFADEPSIYEVQSTFDTATKTFIDVTYDDRVGQVVDALLVEPSPKAFAGPVVGLVNPRTISSGEGVAMCIARSPRGEIVGFHGTNGSFGLAAPGIITLPDGLSVSYPTGRSLDGNGVIQLDSRDGIGGVAPTVRIPLNPTNAVAYASGVDVELAAAEGLLNRTDR